VRRAEVLRAAGAIAAAIAAAIAWGRIHSAAPEEPAPTRPSSTIVSAAVSAQSAAPPARRIDLEYLLTRRDPNEAREAADALAAAAEAGDVTSQIALGKAFLQGTPGVPKDAARARAWFERAAAAGSASGAYYMGVTSQSGEGTPVDPAAAARWLETAAQRGSPHAMFLLANAYRTGAGVPKNPAKALELYERAADLEHPAALQTLAMAYLHGELGLEPDEAESRRYAMEAEHAISHAPAAP